MEAERDELKRRLAAYESDTSSEYESESDEDSSDSDEDDAMFIG